MNIDHISNAFLYGSDRRSIPKLTIYERTSIVGYRAEQIAYGAASFLDGVPESIMNNPIKIAEAELAAGLISVKIARPIEQKGKIKYDIIQIGRDSEVYIFPY